MSRPRKRRSLVLASLPALLLVQGLSSCVVLDRPLLGLRSIAGGIHNRRQVSGIRAFFLPDGRLGVAANGALLLEDEVGGAMVRLADSFAEIDDPAASSDGTRVIFVSGRDQVTAGGGHNDHVFQIYELTLATGEWRRITESERAELLPRYTSDDREIVFVRRPEYAAWSLENPWGEGAVFARAAGAGTEERQLTPPEFFPVRGLALWPDDSLILLGGVTDDGTSNVYAIDYPGGSEPRLVLANAALPTPLGGGEELLVARRSSSPDGAPAASIARIDLDGEVLRDYRVECNEILSLAVSPDASRIVFSDFDPESGRFGRYRLWELATKSGEVRQLDAIEYRITTRYKPLDVVKPLSWWFRSDRSPGSR